jgi:branched-chain amino acid transport system ATP-binding protein
MTTLSPVETQPHESVLLEARDVAVHFGGVKAVDGVSFKLSPGKIYGILGPNGSGKSTLLGAVTRLTQLTRGEILFDQEPFHTVRASQVALRRVARTFQTVRLIPELSVRENIQLGTDARSQRRARKPSVHRPFARGVPSAVTDAVRRTRLEGLEELRPGELPYGTQRRVEIARAIAMDPRLLLLDEPTAGMNQAERDEVCALLRELRAEGLTQLLVEHDVQMMLDTCDHVLAMSSGVLIAEGPPEEVVRNRAVQEAYLGKKWRAHA